MRILVPLAVSALCVVAVELVLLPAAFLTVPRDQYLLGFVASEPRVADEEISSLGFPGDALALERPPGVTRVLTLGGSALFNRRMTRRLEGTLAPLLPGDLEIVGGALRQHTSRASLYKYEHLARYRFDYVLIYHGINDLWANHVAPEEFREDYAHLWRDIGGPWYRRGPLLDRSILCRLAYNRFFHRERPVVVRGAGFTSAAALRRNLEALVQRVGADGGTPVLMTFASCIPPGYSRQRFEAHALGYDDADGYDLCPAEVWGDPDWVLEGLARHNEVIREVARNHDVPLIDQERLMGKDPRRFSDVCHFSDKGVDLFLEHIHAWFRAHAR